MKKGPSLGRGVVGTKALPGGAGIGAQGAD